MEHLEKESPRLMSEEKIKVKVIFKGGESHILEGTKFDANFEGNDLTEFKAEGLTHRWIYIDLSQVAMIVAVR